MTEQDVKDLDATTEQTSPRPEGAREQSEQKSADKSEAKEKSSAKVNWQDDPEYRRIQSENDREKARLAKEAQQAKEEAEANRKRLEALEDQAYGKDDYGKLQLVAQRAMREAETVKQRLAAYEQQAQADAAKREAVNKVATKYKVPVSDLMDATDYDDLIDRAIAARDKQREQQQKDRERDAVDNRPDLGGGGRSTAKTRLESEYDEAAKRKDSVAMARLARQLSAEQK